MNQNSLLALVTLIALLWINGGDCLKGRQNENEVDIAKRQKDVNCPADLLAKYCKMLQKCIKQGPVVHTPPDNKYDEYDHICYAECKKATAVMDARTCCKQACCERPFKCYIEHLGWRAEDEMADEDEADEAKSDEVDIAKRQKGLKILKAWKRDEAEMAAVDEADEDKAQN